MMQAALIFLALLAACFSPLPAVEAGRRLQRRLRAAFAGRPALGICCAALFSLALSAVFGAAFRLPVPHFADEFGYLLQADTFLHGRLKNPTHPLWQFFETCHVIQQPCYTAKFPPAQGAMLAVGRLLGHPIFGVWLSTAFACGAFCWMLFGWLPRGRGAWAGAMLFAVNPLTLAWNGCYYGGTLAFGAGSLVLGGVARFMKNRLRPVDAFASGIGLMILANGRPYEGFALTVAIVTALICSRYLTLPTLRRFVSRCGIYLSVPLLLTMAFVLYYNFEITGRPLKMPYALYEETYDAMPLFLFQKPKPEPVYRHVAMRDQYVNVYLPYYESQRTVRGFFHALIFTKLPPFLPAAWNGLGLLFLAILPFFVPHDRRWRCAWLIVGLFAIASLLPVFTLPYQWAPALPLAYTLLFRTMQRASAWRGWSRRASLLVLLLGALMVVMPVLLLVIYDVKQARSRARMWDFERASLVRNLDASNQKHLIIVRYGAGHDPGHEWVYNGADIDGSKVAFAREMDPRATASLIRYFKDRQIWLLEPDTGNYNLVPYASPKAE